MLSNWSEARTRPPVPSMFVSLLHPWTQSKSRTWSLFFSWFGLMKVIVDGRRERISKWSKKFYLATTKKQLSTLWWGSLSSCYRLLFKSINFPSNIFRRRFWMNKKSIHQNFRLIIQSFRLVHIMEDATESKGLSTLHKYCYSIVSMWNTSLLEWLMYKNRWNYYYWISKEYLSWCDWNIWHYVFKKTKHCRH